MYEYRSNETHYGFDLGEGIDAVEGGPHDVETGIS
jgi:hypothetical protein